MIDKELIKIASNTENFGLIDKYTHFSKLKNPICGDEMKIYLIVEKDKIAKFKYQYANRAFSVKHQSAFYQEKLQVNLLRK